MGEAKRKRSATQKFIEEFPDCYFCGGQRPATTREHMPPKSLFDNSHRPDKLVMPACADCNRDTSTADLTAAIVSRWYYGARSHSDHGRLISQVRIQAPGLVKEWTKLDRGGKERARQHLRNYGVPVPHDAGVASIGPLTIEQLNLFAHKAVLALYFENFRRPLPHTGKVFAVWRSKEDFARDGIPPFLLDMMPEYGTLVQGRWNAHETFEYRHAINAKDGLFACLAKLRQGLFVSGFIVTDASVLESESANDWISPSDPLTLLNFPRFQTKL